MSAWPCSVRNWPLRTSALYSVRNAVLSRSPTRPLSKIRILGFWTAPDGVVHGRVMGTKKHALPYDRVLRTFCGKPWKYPPGSGYAHPHAAPALRAVDFGYYSRMTCDSCARSADLVICGPLPPRADLLEERLSNLELARSVTGALALEDPR